MVSAVVIAAAATVLSLYTLGAEVSYDGQSLGVVSSRHAAEKVVAELEDTFDITVPAVEIIPDNFNSTEAMMEMIQRLQED